MQKVADLRGKSVVVFAASPWAPFIDVYLKSGGLTRDDLKVEVVDPAALWGTYIAKRSDGLMSTDRFCASARRSDPDRRSVCWHLMRALRSRATA
jgi:ABC-type nitrate/sulfonate/bicarbonate transport system substrate-binding protein